MNKKNTRFRLRRAVSYDIPRGRLVSLSAPTSHFYDPATAIGNEIRDAQDPTKAPSKVRTLADMTPERRAEMERLYGNGPAPKR